MDEHRASPVGEVGLKAVTMSAPWTHPEEQLDQLYWLHSMSMLKRMFGGVIPYDLTQQDAVDAEIGVAESENFIITRRGERTGAARFVRLDCMERWVLIGIYIGERWRRCGILTALWPLFERRYGYFTVAPPYTDAMCSFLEKREFLRATGGHTVVQCHPPASLDRHTGKRRHP